MLFSRLWPLFITGFFIVAGYEFIRSPSVSLFQAQYSPHATPYLMVALPFFSFALFYLYGRILTRFGARRTFSITSLVSGVAIYALSKMIHWGLGWATGVLFLFREAYIVLVLEQLWSFLDSVISEREARKVNAGFTALTSIGSVGAGFWVGAFAKSWGSLAMLDLGALTFLPAIIFMNRGYRMNEGRITETTIRGETVSKTTGFQYFAQFKVLRYLFLIAFVAQIASTALGLHFQESLHSAFPNTDDQTAYSGNFYAIMNALSMVFQIALAPFLLAHLPVGLVQLIIPLIQLVVGIWSFSSGSLLAVSASFALFKALDYSLYRSSKEILFISLPYDVRYRTKGWIDIIGYRTAKGFGSVGFSILEYSGALLVNWYTGVVIVCLAMWSYIATRLYLSLKKK